MRRKYRHLAGDDLHRVHQNERTKMTRGLLEGGKMSPQLHLKEDDRCPAIGQGEVKGMIHIVGE